VRLDAQLFFANDAILQHKVRTLARTANPPLRAILLDLEATTLLDISSVDTVAEIATELKAEGIALMLARVRDPVLAMLRRSSVATMIGEEHIYHMVDEGVQDYLSWPN
jgi:MFS superfamily sulfate permease-like transporter